MNLGQTLGDLTLMEYKRSRIFECAVFIMTAIN